MKTMSAFVVNTETMDKCVAAICAVDRYGPVILQFGGIDTQLPDAPSLIGQMLYVMNIESVKQRYPDTVKHPETMPGPADAANLAANYEFSPNMRPLSGYGTILADRMAWLSAFKALECLEYQCAEGDVPQCELFKKLHFAMGVIAMTIVQKLPEYAAAPRG
jgi:hypothetical protein